MNRFGQKKRGVLEGVLKSEKSPISQRIHGYSISLLCRASFFKNLVSSAFEIVNDGSNIVDENEAYFGVLLVHLNLGFFAGPLACQVSVGKI